MKKIRLKQEELEYLRYIFHSGFEINPNLTKREFQKELRILNQLIEKTNKST